MCRRTVSLIRQRVYLEQVAFNLLKEKCLPKYLQLAYVFSEVCQETQMSLNILFSESILILTSISYTKLES